MSTILIIPVIHVYESLLTFLFCFVVEFAVPFDQFATWLICCTMLHDSSYACRELRWQLNIFVVDAFDTEQLLECMTKLIGGQSVQLPIYDFKKHQRSTDSFRQV